MLLKYLSFYYLLCRLLFLRFLYLLCLNFQISYLLNSYQVFLKIPLQNFFDNDPYLYQLISYKFRMIIFFCFNIQSIKYIYITQTIIHIFFKFNIFFKQPFNKFFHVSLSKFYTILHVNKFLITN